MEQKSIHICFLFVYSFFDKFCLLNLMIEIIYIVLFLEQVQDQSIHVGALEIQSIGPNFD